MVMVGEGKGGEGGGEEAQGGERGLTWGEWGKEEKRAGGRAAEEGPAPTPAAADRRAAARAQDGGRRARARAPRAGWKTRGGRIGENCLTSARSEDAGAVDDVNVAAVGNGRWQRRCALRPARARGSCAASTRGGRALGGNTSTRGAGSAGMGKK